MNFDFEKIKSSKLSIKQYIQTIYGKLRLHMINLKHLFHYCFKYFIEMTWKWWFIISIPEWASDDFYYYLKSSKIHSKCHGLFYIITLLIDKCHNISSRLMFSVITSLLVNIVQFNTISAKYQSESSFLLFALHYDFGSAVDWNVYQFTHNTKKKSRLSHFILNAQRV